LSFLNSRSVRAVRRVPHHASLSDVPPCSRLRGFATSFGRYEKWRIHFIYYFS
jgi:hypothetical protein